ncbi:polysaccharide deacetylase [Lederbergia sp. NSJ-179]|uniref:polysaccharide deacetylase family protein n=1 Tax=Lederbergia sp. NSJ-179 TaxID=2931402 RepID=UPI001FD025E6|nr:polysaccharide deacetylase family protein [Lederbergia sp. NSJ-179]MCJ7840782.1 polysaccharide deacetylase [Lederbergia sp. NSJ-179]
MKEHKDTQKRKFSMIILSTLLIVCLFLAGMVLKGKAVEGHDGNPTFEVAQTIDQTPDEKAGFTASKLNESIRIKKETELEKKRQEQALEQLHKDNENRVVYLTFDDGPSPEADQLLDILNQYHAKATFFMLGPKIKQYPAVVQRMVDEGFAIGMHGITHDAQQIYSSAKAPLKEMMEGQKMLQDITGVRSDIIRLPYGSIPYLTEDMRYHLDQQGFKIWDWNIDSEDWKLGDKRFVSKVIRDIENLRKAGESPIILLHDKPKTIQYLPQLLKYLQKNKYQTKVLTNEQAPYTFQCNERCYSINQ